MFVNNSHGWTGVERYPVAAIMSQFLIFVPIFIVNNSPCFVDNNKYFLIKTQDRKMKKSEGFCIVKISFQM